MFDPTGARTGRSQPASPEDLLQLARLDREVYGVHRTALLKRLPKFAERVRVLRDEEGLIVGYGALWRSEDLAAVGPILAPDVAGARDLITDLVEGVEDRLRLDVDAEGKMQFHPGNSKAGDHIDLRAEMNVLVMLNTCQHPLDPNPKYAPKPVKLAVLQTPPPDADDFCRNFRKENQRSFILTERLFMGA